MIGKCSNCKNNNHLNCQMCQSQNDPNNPIQFLGNFEVFKCEYCNKNFPIFNIQSHNCESKQLTQQFYQQERMQEIIRDQTRQNQFVQQNNASHSANQFRLHNQRINDLSEVQSLEEFRNLLRPHRFKQQHTTQQNLIEIKYHRTQNLTEENLKCMICLVEYLENEDQMLLPCTHRFHSKCLKDWIQKQPKCPLCRKNIQAI